MVRLVMDQLERKGKVTRGWLGVTIQELTPELSQEFGLENGEGALVGDVAKGSPADKAGIKRGDIISEYNGKKVKDVGNLRNMVAQSRVGAAVKISILRGKKEYSFQVVIAELPRDGADVVPGNAPEDSSNEGLAGLSVMELTKEGARQLGLRKEERGVVVVRVEPGSNAEDAGIRKGDVIQEIDRRKVVTLADYEKIVAGIRQGETALLFMNRGGKRFYVTLRTS